jgi:hypothetical protein
MSRGSRRPGSAQTRIIIGRQDFGVLRKQSALSPGFLHVPAKPGSLCEADWTALVRRESQAKWIGVALFAFLEAYVRLPPRR